MQLLQPLHTALLVSNLDASKRFYGDILGLSLAERPLDFSGAWYQLGQYQVHLIVDSAVSDAVAQREKWGRNQHLAFAIANIEDAKAHLRSHQWDFQESSSGRPAIFVQDPDGNVIELSQVSPLSLP